MKLRSFLSGAAILAGLFATVTSSSAATMYNQDITAIFGSGNPNTGWAATTDTNRDIQTALRIKDRTTGDTSNVNGLYTSTPGVIPSTTKTFYNIELSINANASGNLIGGANVVSEYEWFFGYDTDPTAGISMMYVNPLAVFADMSYGDNTTMNGGGVVDFMPGAHSLAQNSENGSFAPMSYNPSIAGLYTFELFARENLSTREKFAYTSIELDTRGTTSSVPDNGTTVAMLGAGLTVMGLIGRKTGKGSGKLAASTA